MFQRTDCFRVSIVAAAASLPVVATLMTTPAGAMDCSQARSPLEKAICADPVAKASDEAMGQAFTTLKPLLSPAQAEALLANQRTWLNDRNQFCQSDKAMAACVKTKNDDRVATLTAKPSSGPGTPTKLIPFFVDTPGSRTKPEVHVLMYKAADPSGPLGKPLNTALAAILAPTAKKDPDDAGTKVTYERNATVFYASPKLLTIAIEGMDDAGGPYPNPSTQMIHLDGSGRTLAMTDLLDKTGQDKVFALCLTQLAHQRHEKDIQAAKDTAESTKTKYEAPTPVSADDLKSIGDEARPVVGDLASWQFTPGKATVVFDQGVIGSHAEGAYTCDIPAAQLAPLAKPGFPLP